MTDAELLQQIEASLGRVLTSQQSAQAALWLGYARVIIRKRLGDLTLLDQDALQMVLVESVVAKIKNPDPQRRSLSVSVDDASTQTTYDSSSGHVEILDAWWDLLTPPASRSAAFTITPYGAPDLALPNPWLSA